MKNTSSLSSLVALSLVVTACGPQHLVPMHPSDPIEETASGYAQGGRLIDPGSMTKTLEQEPDSREHVARAQTLATVAIILSSVGGALAGWPLGEAAAGEKKPLWGLAAAGGGAIALSIPIAIWSSGSMSKAVRAHNDSVNRRGAIEPDAARRPPAERR